MPSDAKSHHIALCSTTLEERSSSGTDSESPGKHARCPGNRYVRSVMHPEKQQDKHLHDWTAFEMRPAICKDGCMALVVSRYLMNKTGDSWFKEYWVSGSDFKMRERSRRVNVELRKDLGEERMEKLAKKVVGKVSQLNDRFGLGLYVEYQPGKPEVWMKNWANGDKTGKVGWFFWSKAKDSVRR